MSYKVVKDSNGNIIAFGPNEDSYEPVAGIGQILSIVNVLPTKTNAQLMAEELVALADEYKETTTQLQLSWLAAVVNDGATEEAKKQIVVDSMTATKAKYISDVAAVKSKYA